jgi:tetratricopeptide (TPR) repeat protein
VALAVLGTGGYGLWLKYTPPEPPAVDLTGLDQEVIDALEAARAGVRERPRSAEAWGTLGATLRAHAFMSEAGVCFLEAQYLDPKDPRWPYMLGTQRSDQDAAVQDLRRAVELGPDLTVPRLRLAEVLLERGEAAEAEKLFRGVVGKGGVDEARAELGLGRVALEANDVEAALVHLNRAAQAVPRAKVVHVVLAQAYRRQGEEKRAEEELQTASGLPEGLTWPDPATDYVNRFWTGLRARMAQITALDEQGLHEEAVVAAQAAVAKYPDQALTHLVLGEMCNRSGSFRRAGEALQEAIRLDPKRPKSYFELGYTLQALDRVPQAAEAYRKCLELQPDFAQAHFNLALCLEGLKDQAAPLEHLRAAVRYRPGFPEALMKLAQLLAGQGQSKEALDCAEEAARVAPSDPRTAELLDEMRAYLCGPPRP